MAALKQEVDERRKMSSTLKFDNRVRKYMVNTYRHFDNCFSYQRLPYYNPLMINPTMKTDGKNNESNFFMKLTKGYA